MWQTGHFLCFGTLMGAGLPTSLSAYVMWLTPRATPGPDRSQTARIARTGQGR